MAHEKRTTTEEQLRNRLATWDVRMDDHLLADATFRETIPGPLCQNKASGYVFTKSPDGKTVYLHRLIVEYARGITLRRDQYIDHQDRDRSNNLIANLRVCTAGENAKNRSRGSNNTSGMVGVSPYRNGKWLVYIDHDGKRKHVGYFEEYEAAVIARIEAATKHHGRFSGHAPGPRDREAEARAALREKIRESAEHIGRLLDANQRPPGYRMVHDPRWADGISRRPELGEPATLEERYEHILEALETATWAERDRLDREITRLLEEEAQERGWCTARLLRFRGKP